MVEAEPENSRILINRGRLLFFVLKKHRERKEKDKLAKLFNVKKGSDVRRFGISDGI